ncbi:MAG: DUF6515 family protein [Verrucomicrobiae bacterium]|nr:DUF6515 family protein [Verrucomicrobiae bacterium]
MKTDRGFCGLTGLVGALMAVLMCADVCAQGPRGGHGGGPWGGPHGGPGPGPGGGFDGFSCLSGFFAGVVIGTLVADPPPRYVKVYVAGAPYYYCDGVYYRTCPGGYVVVNAPPGIVVPSIPINATPVVIGGVTHYYIGGVYYLPQPAGYVVVNSPQQTVTTVVTPVTTTAVVQTAPVVTQTQTTASASTTGASSSAASIKSGFQQLGHDWAKDLRGEVATWQQFVDYLKANLVSAPSGNSEEFRKGFVTAYGINGDAAFEKAFRQAKTG